MLRNLLRINVIVKFGIVMLGGLHAFVCQAQTAASAATQTATPLEFEVASVKPSASEGHGTSVRVSNGSLTASGATVKHLISMGYDLRDFQISGGPGWIGTDRFDIEAKVVAEPAVPNPKPMTDEQRKVLQEQFRERVRSLLAERFHFEAHKETKEMPIYALVQAKGGSKLVLSKSAASGNQGTHSSRGVMEATSTTMEMLANLLADTAGRPVIDKTGLKDKYDWKLEWTPDAGQMKPKVPGETQGAAAPTSDISGPSIFTALQEQLGLKLESQKGLAPILVVDRVEKLSAN